MKKVWMIVIGVFYFLSLSTVIAEAQPKDLKNTFVTDSKTGLVWQAKDDGKTRTWLQAREYCKKLELGGFTDWRLPESNELKSLVPYFKTKQTTAKAGFAPLSTYLGDSDQPVSIYWSSTIDPKVMPGSPRSADAIEYPEGMVFQAYVTETSLCRCVR